MIKNTSSNHLAFLNDTSALLIAPHGDSVKVIESGGWVDEPNKASPEKDRYRPFRGKTSIPKWSNECSQSFKIQ